ncbi:5-formyltetrahydrofolate cyclo-ligase [Hydrogenobacter thermophilus]|uniref:5-formyltetrahydrofolate cyclo-ligase n=1 Tax=Hydrogenobacter thermophilus TaxID=940 RepID=UPI0030FA4E36
MKVLKKSELRRAYLNRREAMGEEEVFLYSERIKRGVKSLPDFKDAKKILFYCPIKNEPDLTSLIWESISLGKEALLPKVDGDRLRIYKVEHSNQLKPGSFCILEPEDGTQVEPEEVDFALVPGIVFDTKGYRIGFGKGFYDRLLKRVKGVKVGVAYSFQVLEEIPVDSWDEPVDLLITETYILKGGKKYEY